MKSCLSKEKGDSRILHQNLLLPCNHLPLKIPLKVVQQPKKKCISKSREGSTIQSEGSSDDEDDWYCYLPVQPPPAVQSEADENTIPTETGPANDAVNSESREEPVNMCSHNSWTCLRKLKTFIHTSHGLYNMKTL